MINIIILFTISVWYYFLFKSIEQKEWWNKILYILFTTFLWLLFVFLWAIFDSFIFVFIFFFLYLFAIISIYTDFLIFIRLNEIYLKSKKIRKTVTTEISKTISDEIKKDIRDIKSTLLAFWWYNDFWLDLWIISTWISVLIITSILLK